MLAAGQAFTPGSTLHSVTVVVALFSNTLSVAGSNVPNSGTGGRLMVGAWAEVQAVANANAINKRKSCKRNTFLTGEIVAVQDGVEAKAQWH